MNNPFDYIPSVECKKAFRELVSRLEILKGSKGCEDINFCNELEAGKMLGVLIAEDQKGIAHTLYAFSGQLGNGGFHYPGFVEPVFDYLQPDGYFKTKERDISRQNMEIALYEVETLGRVREEYELVKKVCDDKVSKYKEQCRLAKLERKRKREVGLTSEVELEAMIRQSQFEKAELHRLKKRMTAEIEPLEVRLKDALRQLEVMKNKRRSDSEELQQWLFSNFRLFNANGESKSLNEIFSETPMKVAPSGAGECCAPKLLQAAYQQGLKPVAIAEYWYGRPKGGEVRRHGQYYPACRGKCLPVLSWMLKGLPIEPPIDAETDLLVLQEPEIIYENQWFCVVNKPSGMLSVPGRGSAISVQQWLALKYDADRLVKMVHRLDQDTSGLIIAAFGEETFKEMQALFATRRIHKTYIAELEGDYRVSAISRQGRIDLPLLPDWLDRPRQRVDYESGREALTDYEFIGVTAGRSRIKFYPHTGRTHQLRVHAASEMGLGMPIAGDRLYGEKVGNVSGRLLLHAQKIEFTFPIDGKHYSFESPVPF